MRLSEAIRLGSMIRPQAFGTLFDVASGSSCALGAAGEAVGLLDTTQNNTWKTDARARAPQEWKWAKKAAACPMCGDHFDIPKNFFDRRRDAQALIVHLNNDHRWTREAIADLIERLETTMAADAVDPVLADSHELSPREQKGH